MSDEQQRDEQQRDEDRSTHHHYHQQHPRFSGLLTVWGGAEDLHNVSEDSLLGWREHVEAEEQFSFKLFKGSHFYFSENEAKSEFMEALCNICLACNE